MNFTNLICWVFILITTSGLTAQNSITGNIKDANTLEAITGVSIYIADLKTGTSSNDKGNYQIANIRSGNYYLEISYLGYKSIIFQININKDTVMNFLLNPSINELSEIIVTGISRSTELKLNPIIVKPIDRNALNQNISSNVIDGLKNIPGVNQITSGVAISKPVIRGLGYNRVISLYNGIKQEGQQWGDEHGIEIDEYSVDRVEIVKGPGSMMYGSDGIAGVLNFLTPKTTRTGEIKSQFSSNYQSNNNLIAYSLSNAGNKSGLHWLGRITNKFAGNYKNDLDGKVFNSGYKEYDGSLAIGVNRNWGHSHWDINSYNNSINLPEGERDSLGRFIFTNPNGDEVIATKSDLTGYKTGFPYQKINHLRVSSINLFVFKKGSLNVDLGFQNNRRREFGDATNPNVVDLAFNLNSTQSNIRYHFDPLQGWETSVGISNMYQSNTNSGIDFLIPEYRLIDAGAFIFSKKSFKKITLAGGIRTDIRNINTSDLILDSLGMPSDELTVNSKIKFKSFNKNYPGFSGSFGLSFLTSNISTLKFNVSRGFRVANIAELSSNGRHEGTFRYELGNQDLKPEISHQIDIAYFLNAEHIALEITPFVNFISNYIYSRKLKANDGTDSIPDPADPAPAFVYTSGRTTLFGGEIYFDVHPHPLDWLHLENTFSFVLAEQNNQPDSLKYLPFIPPPKYRGEIRAQFIGLGNHLSNVYFKLGIDHYFAQNRFFRAYGTENSTPSYTLFNIGLGCNITAFKRKDFFNLYISGENLTNKDYQSHLSRLKYAPINLSNGKVGIFNMGRNLSFKLIINF